MSVGPVKPKDVPVTSKVCPRFTVIHCCIKQPRSYAVSPSGCCLHLSSKKKKQKYKVWSHFCQRSQCFEVLNCFANTVPVVYLIAFFIRNTFAVHLRYLPGQMYKYHPNCDCAGTSSLSSVTSQQFIVTSVLHCCFSKHHCLCWWQIFTWCTHNLLRCHIFTWWCHHFLLWY